MRDRLQPWQGPVASAILLAVAFEGVWPLAFVALIPLLWSLRDSTPRQAWNRGYAFGLLFSLSQLWWLGDLAYKWIGNPLLGLLPWILAASMSAVYYGLLGRLIRSCRTLGAVWAVPLVWAGMEVFRSYIPILAFPWALLAEPLMAAPKLAASAHYGTVVLASALVVAVNGIVYKLYADRANRRRWTVHTFRIVVWTVVLGSLGADGRESLATVAAGQPGVDMGVAMAQEPDTRFQIGPSVDALTAVARGVDLLVLPEGIAMGGAAIPPTTPFAVPDRPAVVFGGQRGEGPRYQSAFAHDARGWTYADKTRLVIFGEFVPGRDLFPFVGEAFHLPGGDLSAGGELGTVRADRLKVGPLICFEGLFPDLGLRQAWAGADLLAVMSIDDWFHPWARARLARAAQWRAVEAGLPLVRAGSLGRTMIVSASGAVLADAPMGGRRLVVAKIARGSGPFPLVWVFPAAALSSLVVVPLLARKRRSANGEPGVAATL